MDFTPPPKRRATESIVPMINVVFLLLIFFLMTSHLATPEPFDVTLPNAGSDREPLAELHVFVDQTGQLAFEDLRDDAAIAALVAASATGDTPIQLRADGRVEAARIARLLRRLAAAGLSQVELAVSPR